MQATFGNVKKLRLVGGGGCCRCGGWKRGRRWCKPSAAQGLQHGRGRHGRSPCWRHRRSALYRKYQQQGLEVLGFPANEFGAQEPGSEADIQSFCSTQYDVTFPLFAKIVVKGPGQHPLYAALTELQPTATKLPGTDFRAELLKHGIDTGAPSDILWNFEKFLVDRSGQVVARFSPDVPPDSELLVSAIERELSRVA